MYNSTNVARFVFINLAVGVLHSVKMMPGGCADKNSNSSWPNHYYYRCYRINEEGVRLFANYSTLSNWFENHDEPFLQKLSHHKYCISTQ